MNTEVLVIKHNGITYNIENLEIQTRILNFIMRKSKKQQPRNSAYKHWTPEEVKELKDFIEVADTQGKDPNWQDFADQSGRTEKSVWSYAWNKLKWRRPEKVITL